VGSRNSLRRHGCEPRSERGGGSCGEEPDLGAGAGRGGARGRSWLSGRVDQLKSPLDRLVLLSREQLAEIVLDAATRDGDSIDRIQAGWPVIAALGSAAPIDDLREAMGHRARRCCASSAGPRGRCDGSRCPLAHRPQAGGRALAGDHRRGHRRVRRDRPGRDRLGIDRRARGDLTPARGADVRLQAFLAVVEANVDRLEAVFADAAPTGQRSELSTLGDAYRGCCSATARSRS
jgi:hypothetical protein